MKNYVFTSESVSEGHPDKVADQISDKILDSHLKGDPESRVACETLVKNNTVILAGEITSNCEVNYDEAVRATIENIGYTDTNVGFDHNSANILVHINQQSQDICVGVDEGSGEFKEQGAGDQGLMFGYACNETPELMPLAISLSHQLVSKLASVRKAGRASFLRPDSKAQVSLNYSNGRPISVNNVVLSTMHDENISQSDLKTFVREQVINEVIPSNFLTKNTEYFINPTGRFVIGGPVGDCGLTGRKIIVDTYGGYSRHGGGAFSGKDPSKVDRSAAYMARYIAKNIVSAGFADKCEVQLAYAIGVAEPVSVFVEAFGTEKVELAKLEKAIPEVFKLTPKGIIAQLDLKKPIFFETAAYGHFGREPSSNGHFSWEKTDQVEELKKICG